jgi:hypothetical protein
VASGQGVAEQWQRLPIFLHHDEHDGLVDKRIDVLAQRIEAAEERRELEAHAESPLGPARPMQDGLDRIWRKRRCAPCGLARFGRLGG